MRFFLLMFKRKFLFNGSDVKLLRERFNELILNNELYRWLFVLEHFFPSTEKLNHFYKFFRYYFFNFGKIRSRSDLNILSAIEPFFKTFLFIKVECPQNQWNICFLHNNRYRLIKPLEFCTFDEMNGYK